MLLTRRTGLWEYLIDQGVYIPRWFPGLCEREWASDQFGLRANEDQAMRTIVAPLSTTRVYTMIYVAPNATAMAFGRGPVECRKGSVATISDLG